MVCRRVVLIGRDTSPVAPRTGDATAAAPQQRLVCRQGICAYLSYFALNAVRALFAPSILVAFPYIFIHFTKKHVCMCTHICAFSLIVACVRIHVHLCAFSNRRVA